MRKTTKNEKVIRAITIALATMITVSASPISVLAEENADSDNDTNTSGSESSSEETSSSSEESSQSEETSTVAEAESVCENAEAIIEGTSVAEDVPAISLPETIEDAAAAVAAVEASFAAPAETLEQISAELTEAGNFVEATKSDVDTAETNIAAASEAQGMADTMTTAAAASVDTINSGIETIKNEAAAANSASADLTSMEAGLAKVNSAYESASAAAVQAEAEYQAAEIAHAKAVAELDKANEAIRNAQGNATAAQERMKAAQAKVDALESKVNTLAENKEALENLREEYYNYLVHYYRNDAKTAVYKADGSLDLEESAKKAVSEGKAVDPGFCNNTLLLGRELLRELVTLKLTMNGADADSIVFAAEGSVRKEAADGTLTTDNKGMARVTIDNSTKYTQLWEYQNGESGRNHCAKVTYTKNGEEITEHYNYIAKASKYNDTLDLENGTIFLANVEKGEDGKWHSSADNSEFNFSDYSKLLEAINIAAAASEDMNEYNRAKEAVDAAAAEVDRLKDELDKINKVSVDGSVLRSLKAALEQAQEDLVEAKETRDALADKVAKARAIVESVDLSGFEGSEEVTGIAGDVVAAAEASTGAAAVAAASTEAGTEAVAATSTETVAEASVEANVAVLGARVYENTTVAAEETGKEEVQIVIAEDDETEDNANVNAEIEGTKKLVKIEENEVPLAEIPFETDDNISWWWLLVIALLGATGKAMYENYRNKEEANA